MFTTRQPVDIHNSTQQYHKPSTTQESNDHRDMQVFQRTAAPPVFSHTQFNLAHTPSAILDTSSHPLGRLPHRVSPAGILVLPPTAHILPPIPEQYMCGVLPQLQPVPQYYHQSMQDMSPLEDSHQLYQQQSHEYDQQKQQQLQDHDQQPRKQLKPIRGPRKNPLVIPEVVPNMGPLDDYATARIDGEDVIFTCKKCYKAFTRIYNLKSHLRTHGADKPYACNECGKAFLRKSDMFRHAKVHTRTMQVTCPRCKCTYARQESLNTHLEKEAQCKEYLCCLQQQQLYQETNMPSMELSDHLPRLQQPENSSQEAIVNFLNNAALNGRTESFVKTSGFDSAMSLSELIPSPNVSPDVQGHMLHTNALHGDLLNHMPFTDMTQGSLIQSHSQQSPTDNNHMSLTGASFTDMAYSRPFEYAQPLSFMVGSVYPEHASRRPMNTGFDHHRPNPNAHLMSDGQRYSSSEQQQHSIPFSPHLSTVNTSNGDGAVSGPLDMNRQLDMLMWNMNEQGGVN